MTALFLLLLSKSALCEDAFIKYCSSVNEKDLLDTTTSQGNLCHVDFAVSAENWVIGVSAILLKDTIRKTSLLAPDHGFMPSPTANTRRSV